MERGGLILLGSGHLGLDLLDLYRKVSVSHLSLLTWGVLPTLSAVVAMLTVTAVAEVANQILLVEIGLSYPPPAVVVDGCYRTGHTKISSMSIASDDLGADLIVDLCTWGQPRLPAIRFSSDQRLRLARHPSHLILNLPGKSRSEVGS
jgi:hypothetical protein